MSTVVRTQCGVTLSVSVEPLMVAPLSKCCEGAATGSGMQVVCKGCWRPVPSEYGYCATTVLELADMMVRFGNCPCAMECAVHTLWTAEREMEESQ